MLCPECNQAGCEDGDCLENQKDCFDCKFYDSNQFVCMYNYKIECILDERHAYLNCKDFVKGDYNEDDLE